MHCVQCTLEKQCTANHVIIRLYTLYDTRQFSVKTSITGHDWFKCIHQHSHRFRCVIRWCWKYLRICRYCAILHILCLSNKKLPGCLLMCVLRLAELLWHRWTETNNLLYVKKFMSTIYALLFLLAYMLLPDIRQVYLMLHSQYNIHWSLIRFEYGIARTRVSMSCTRPDSPAKYICEHQVTLWDSMLY